MARQRKIKEKQTSANFDVRSFIIKTLRGAFKKTPMYREAKGAAKEEFFVDSKHGKPMRRIHYRCAACGQKFMDKTGQREIAVDHVIPIIDPKLGWVDYNSFVLRLFCSLDNLQVLCKPCHSIKSKEENEIRRISKKELKKKDESTDNEIVAKAKKRKKHG